MVFPWRSWGFPVKSFQPIHWLSPSIAHWCLAGNGELGWNRIMIHGYIIDHSWSFPHSLRLAPVRYCSPNPSGHLVGGNINFSHIFPWESPHPNWAVSWQVPDTQDSALKLISPKHVRNAFHRVLAKPSLPASLLFARAWARRLSGLVPPRSDHLKGENEWKWWKMMVDHD